MPVARKRARAPAILRPWVEVRERSCAMHPLYSGMRDENVTIRTPDRGGSPLPRRQDARSRTTEHTTMVRDQAVPTAGPRTSPTGRAISCPWGGRSADAELVHDDLADLPGIGLTAGGLHDRTDQGPDRLDLAALDLGDHIGVVGDGLIDRGGEHR